MLLSARMPANKTGKKAVQGNSMMVTMAANRKIAPIKVKTPVLPSNIFWIFLLSFSEIPPNWQTAAPLLLFKNSLKKYIAPTKAKNPISSSILFMKGARKTKS